MSLEKQQVYDSLQLFQINTMTKYQTGKALKDIVGAEFEAHTGRVAEIFGLKPRKYKVQDCFNADHILHNTQGKVVAIEEDKGHYVDACFFKRAVLSFAEVALSYNERGEECPYLILSSVTRFKGYEEKFESHLRLLDKDIRKILREKMRYFYLVDHDRYKRSDWFPNSSSPLDGGKNLDANIEELMQFYRSLQC
tara:strand:+ start:1769 stop:2353 length:585 start_codon:yes stop_codon:yes gene_type:complete